VKAATLTAMDDQTSTNWSSASRIFVERWTGIVCFQFTKMNIFKDFFVVVVGVYSEFILDSFFSRNI
jgi:hypothetical protein